MSLLVRGLQQQFFDKGFFSPFIYLTGQPLFGKSAVGPVVTGTTGPRSGRQADHRLLQRESRVWQRRGVAGDWDPRRGDRGPGGDLLPEHCGRSPMATTAPARWYFPTQADGSVDARGVIYLQHGFLATGG